jgi:serine/threonine-protein kinase
MEFLEGRTLQALLKERDLSFQEVLDLLSPLAGAVDHAHRAGVVHGDIKPVNIMIQPDGCPKLMDFGIARVDTSLITVPGHFFGSPAYMAPEQIRGEEITSRADLFSLAVVAYEALTGKGPFEGDTVSTILYKVVHQPVASARLWKRELPEACDAVFGRALAKAPELRFPSARAFVAALGGEGEAPFMPVDPKPTAHPGVETLPFPAARRRARRPALLMGVVALLVAGSMVVRQRLVLSGEPGEVPRRLRIETTPPGATVWLDGAIVGRSPLELTNLRPGPRQLRILEEGYAPAEVGLELAEGTTAPPLRFVMSPMAAPLSVGSEPNGATVRVDGRSIGKAPIDALLLGPGLHDLRVEQQGFRAQVRRIEARAGEPLRVSVRLEPLVGPGPGPPSAKPRAAPTPSPAPLAEGTLVEMDASVTPPVHVSGNAAPYPQKAKKLKLRESVLVEMIVTEKGEPNEIHVLESATALLDEAVVKAVRSWRFEPARKDGVKVRVRWQYRQTFQLR